MLVCDSVQKPLLFLHLVHKHGVTNALVFTKSTESTTRLVQLFEFFEQARLASNVTSDSTSIIARSYSSDLGAAERKSILEQFKQQKINM